MQIFYWAQRRSQDFSMGGGGIDGSVRVEPPVTGGWGLGANPSAVVVKGVCESAPIPALGDFCNVSIKIRP